MTDGSKKLLSQVEDLRKAVNPVKVLAVLVLCLFSVHASAQRFVIPNKPYSFLGSTPGYIMINEGIGGICFNGSGAAGAKTLIGLNSIHGYQVNRTFIIAAGTGISMYNDGIMVPVFLDFRFNFAIRTLSPFIMGEGGLLINPGSSTALFISPGAGIRYAPSRNFAFNIGSALLVQVAGTQDVYLTFRAGLAFRPSR
jgi:hypothetical protein